MSAAPLQVYIRREAQVYRRAPLQTETRADLIVYRRTAGG